MSIEKSIGLLLITGAIGVLIPYTALTIIFDYPDILRKDAGEVLTKFHAGGGLLIFIWWAFAMLGLPLLIAYIKIGQLLEHRVSFIKWATTLGVISGIVQIIGLLRWVFVVPALANIFVQAADVPTKSIAAISFTTIHQLGGVLLGEHIGQLFTIAWTMLVSMAFIKVNYMPKWVSYFGMTSGIVYLAAQAELFATVIPGFPVWNAAGFIGSTLWLIWLILVGIYSFQKKSS